VENRVVPVQTVADCRGECKAKDGRLQDVDEGRKQTLGIMASILAARRLAQAERVRMVPATVSAIADAVQWADEILKEIDRKWPEPGVRK
jgi:hypothetical protein